MLSFRNFFMFVALLILLAGCGDINPESESANEPLVESSKETKDDPQPGPNALHRPGPIGDGRYVLPNGRLVKPAGDFVATPVFPIDVGISPDGNTAVISTSSKQTICIYDIAQGIITSQFDTKGAFTGIVFNAAGDRFYASGGGDHSIYVYELIAGQATFLYRIGLAGFPSDLVLSNDENFIYTVLNMNKRMVKVRISDGKEMASYPAHLYPYEVAVSPDEKTAYISNLGVNAVSVIDLATKQEIDIIDVEHHPEGLALSPSGDTLYVANMDSDSISVIDTASLEVTATWNLHDDQVLTMGAMPVAIEIDPTGSTLYVTCAGYDSVDVIDTSDGTILGRIPTGWYPTNADIDYANGRLAIVSGKGVGSHGTEHGVNWPGIFQIIDLPSPAELATYTEDTENGLKWATTFYEEWRAQKAESPIPFEWGIRSEQIKHVVFILKENKTYDQVLGDFADGEGDPNFTTFGEAITPNTHALAKEFVNCDNHYVEGDVSVIGHLWATYASVNDHAEKSFLSTGKYPLPEIDQGTIPEHSTIFMKMLDHGLEFRAYGQIIGFMEDFDRAAPYIDLHYGFWNMGTSDETQKAEEIIREWEKGMFPDFIYIVLPNDHNYGGKAGAPTPRWLMADNDAGLGKLIDWLSKSKYWNETAVFVTEDDPQSGWDHIDPHRTISLVISPWAKRDYTSSVLYSQSSIWMTINLILGLPPSSKFDQYASPMYDAFMMEPDYTPYNYITNPIPFEVNGEDKFKHLLCDEPNFLVPDGAPGLARVLWAMYKPGQPFPERNSIDHCNEIEDEEEEEGEDVEYYVEAVNKAVAWGKKRGITVPVPDGWAELTARIEAEEAAEEKKKTPGN